MGEPASFSPDMRVPARLYADEDLLGAALEDRSIEQLVNTATLPGMVRYAIAMPDIHQGYNFPIGGVIATRLPDGVISPGGVGYDINCGLRVYLAPENHPVTQGPRPQSKIKCTKAEPGLAATNVQIERSSTLSFQPGPLRRLRLTLMQ
jgi:hypothetical protein